MPSLLGLVAFAVSLMLLISLATFDPRDPAPFFKAGKDQTTRNFIGPFGAFIAELLIPQMFGLAALLLPLVLGLFGWKLFWCRPLEAPYTKATGLLLLLLSLTAFLTLSFQSLPFAGEDVRAGGWIGESLSGFLVAEFSRTGAFIVVSTSLFVALILSTQFSFASALGFVGAITGNRVRGIRTAWNHWRETRRKERLRRDVIRKHAQRQVEASVTETVPKRRNGAPAKDDQEEDALRADVAELSPRSAADTTSPAQKALVFPTRNEAEDAEASGEASRPSVAARRSTKRASRGETAQGETRGNFTLPPLSLLDEPKAGGGPDHARLYEKGRILQAKCQEFGVLGTVKEIHPGPVVTTYEFKPDAGIKYSKIVGLSEDLALALEAESIRIDRISGKGNVGIEIPNETRETIMLRDVLEADMFRRSGGRLTMALGKTVSGDPCVSDLATMPHLLIAGSTGQGKSVGLNCMIASILFRSTPDEVRLILIDPKRLELGVYEDIPHLMTPVVTDPKIASNVLKWAIGEMERRIRRLASEGVRNIEQYNNIIRAERGNVSGDEDLRPLHYIVIIIDELADLMMVSSHEVEESITRLAQMARAVGIHLILATQRPSVDVITGLIKANFPSRISFKVAARVDSRTILDSIGAEQLLGRGDMLFLPPGSSKLVRIHGAFVSEQEVARLTSFLRKVGQAGLRRVRGQAREGH